MEEMIQKIFDEIRGLREAMGEEFKAVRKEMNEEFKAVRAEIQAFREETTERLDALKDDTETIRTQAASITEDVTAIKRELLGIEYIQNLHSQDIAQLKRQQGRG